jgi:transposase
MKEINLNIKNRKPRQKYDETYKRHAVELSLSSTRTIRAVAQELGVTQSMLYRWRELYAPRPGIGDGLDGPRTLGQAEDEIRHLRAEVIRMRERESVLKKSLGILSETPESGMPRSKR